MQMKILTWNICYKDCLDNLPGIISELCRFDADVACLQEVAHRGDINHIKPLLDLYPYSHFAEADPCIGNNATGSAILSRYPILSTQDIFIQRRVDDSHNFEDEGRIYTEAVLDINASRLTIGTTHCSYARHFSESPKKDIEMNNLLELIKPKKSNYILTGDLNAAPDTKYIRAIESYLKNLGPEYGQKTFSTKPFSHDGFEVNSLEYRIDYIFGTNDLVVRNASVLESALSDHLPILVEI